MSGTNKITPRARRLAAENGLDTHTAAISGTGFGGGICEADVRAFLANNPASGNVAQAVGAKGPVYSGLASPLARKTAAATGVDLAGLAGTGSHGKVMAIDVLTRTATSTAAAAQAAAGPAGSPAAAPRGKTLKEVVPYSGVRRIIGERLALSKFTAPHLYFTHKVNLEKLLELRQEVNKTLEAAEKKKTSVTDYIARAAIMSLQKYPMLNASLVGDKIEVYESVNLGIAVAAPSGLIVPVIRNGHTKSLTEISAEAAALFDKARKGKLTVDEYNGGTFTLSNLGMFGIENFTAIINPPESGILAVSATKDEPVVVVAADGAKSIAIKPMMNITLTVDHRIIDGLLAAQFVGEVKRILEHPVETLL